MPDKEFDNLFREKFMDAEIEPSANLWANIERKLEPKSKRTIPIYWMTAAAVTLCVSAMLLFQKKEVIQLQGNTNPVAKVEQPVEPVNLDNIQTVETTSRATTVKYVAARKVQPKREVVQTTINTPSENILASVQPTEKIDRLAIKSMDAKPLDVTPVKEVVYDNPIVIAALPIEDKNELVAVEERTTERKGIKNVGDLVNYVVEKVDKREKKLVRFNTDDDDSSLIGINIGFLKFNKKNKN